jgi:hypothetical protein
MIKARPTGLLSKVAPIVMGFVLFSNLQIPCVNFSTGREFHYSKGDMKS